MAKLLLWSVALVAAAMWASPCAYTEYDLRRSTDSCVRLKSSTECVPLQPGCVAPASVATASPRWLATLAGDGGTLLTWLPLYATATSERDALPLILMWYLGLIGPVRHTHRLLHSRWDPSGHVFVYGAQLVPYWLAVSPRPPYAGAWLWCWAGVLCYLSAMTAAFFHTPSETAAGWALVAALWAALRWATSGSDGPRPPPSWLPAVSLVAWVGCTAGAWLDASAGERPTLFGQLLYDGALWLLALLLPRPVRHGEMVSGAEMRQLERGAGGESASAPLRRRERSPPEEAP